MTYHTILFEINESMATITINRPDKLNALNKSVFNELNEAIDEVIQNTGIRSAIITGCGEKAFVAGADIAELLSLDAASGQMLARRGQQVFDKIENASKVFVAAVNGYALGGGCELAMACHIRVACENAKFGMPETNLGLLPGYGGTQRLAQLVGKGRAIELLATGAMIDAITAFNYGLANHVVTQDQLLPKAKALLAVIHTKAPLAVAAAIRAVHSASADDNGGFLLEAELFGKLLETEDAREGISAFLKKRKAIFKGC